MLSPSVNSIAKLENVSLLLSSLPAAAMFASTSLSLMPADGSCPTAAVFRLLATAAAVAAESVMADGPPRVSSLGLWRQLRLPTMPARRVEADVGSWDPKRRLNNNFILLTDHDSGVN
jgi:hypothetical protein